MTAKIFLTHDEVKEAVRKYASSLGTWYTENYSPNEIDFEIKDGKISCHITWNDRSNKNIPTKPQIVKTSPDLNTNYDDFGYGRQ